MQKKLTFVAPYLFLTAVSVVIYAPLLFFGQIFASDEQMGFYYTISHYVDASIAAGYSLDWISAYFGGVPASFDQFVSAWYPLNRALFYLFDLFLAHHLSITIATAAGFIGCFLFGRANGWYRASSICLALLYFLTTTFTWLQIGTTAAHSFAILPFLLLGVLRARTGQYVSGIAIGSAALAIGFLAGFVQIVFYDFLIAGAYALFLDWQAFSRTKAFVKNFYVSYAFAAITLIGLAIGFVQFYPSASLIDLTIRTSTYASQNVSTQYPTEFLALVMPAYLDVPFLGGGHSSGFYLTPIGLICAFLALIYYRRHDTLFFAGLYAIMAAFAFHLPIFGWLNEHVPPFSNMGGQFRWMVGAAFPFAFLGAAGIEGLLRDPLRISQRARKIVVAITAGIGVAMAAGATLTSIVADFLASSSAAQQKIIDWYTAGRTLVHPAEHYQHIMVQAMRTFETTFSLASPRFLFGTILWFIAAALFAWSFFYRGSRYMPVAIVSFVTFATLGSVALQWSELVPQSLLQETPPLIANIRSHEDGSEPYRIMGYLVGEGLFLQGLTTTPLTPSEMTSIQMQGLYNNSNVYFGIERMDGMEPYRTLRHNHLLNTVIAYDWAAWAFDDASPLLHTSPLDRLYNRDVLKNVPIEDKLPDLVNRLPLLSMMNVKYLYSPYSFEAPSLKALAQIPIGVNANMRTLYLYENKKVLPRAYAVASPVFATSERDAFLKVISIADFSNQTVIECTTCGDSTSGNAIISIENYGQGILKTHVKAETPSWIVFSESAFPGWHATIDGVEAPIYTANYLFQAVNVPAGEHTLEFRYEDVAVGAVRSLFR